MHCKYQDIFNIIEAGFIEKGLSLQSANNVTRGLLIAECAGETSHGLRMRKCVNQMIMNQSSGDNVKLINKTNSFAVVDCNYNIGFDTAKYSMDLAIKEANREGIYTVFARHANTFGAAFVYGLQAVKDGMIGILMANTPAQMTVYGGEKKMLGTNPICFAIPAKDESPIIFDMASSKVAKSRINNAAEHGEEIPEDWGLDKEGQRTINPQDVLDGDFLLPFADSPKGYGIAMMIDMFAGLLSGAACLDEVGYLKSGKMNVGQIFIAIDPKKIYGDDFYAQVDAYIRKVKASGDNVRLPGENKLRNLQRAENEGFELDDMLYRQIIEHEE